MDNYPPGTWVGDPHAPWNQQDEPREIVCPHCNTILDDEVDNCPWCGMFIDWDSEVD